jgi:signal transduction histidine kinase
MRIRTRATILGLLPALLLAAVLVTYLSVNRLADLETTLQNRGAALSRYIALGAQYGVVSGNTMAMQPMLEQALQEPDVLHIAIYRPDGNLVIEAGTPSSTLLVPLERVMRDSTSHIAFSVPVEISPPEVDDFFLPQTGDPARIVAWVQVTMSRAGNIRIARMMLFNSLVIVGLGVLFSALLVRILALTGVKPLMELIEAVGRIGDGDLRVSLPLSAKSELKALQAGINRMTERLALHEQELQDRIESATAELARQKEAAEQAYAAKSKFLAAASHDLRQPLHALGLFVASLKQRRVAPEDAGLMEKIEASVAALTEMFNTLLDLSRLEAGTLVPDIQTIPLQALFIRLGNEHGVQAEEKSLRLVIRPSPLLVRSDPMLLNQILSNLLSNAIRYTDRGGVLVAARRRGHDVCIQVWDTGIGIDAETLPHIYEEYFQAGNAARNRSQGLGLGLNIVHRLCGLLAHRLHVRSVPGRGTVFSLFLPVADTAHVERRQAADRHLRGFQGETVLLVEDDPVVLNALQTLLSEWGLQVVKADSLDAAFAALAEGVTLSAIVSDYRLGEDVTGIQVIERLRGLCGTRLPAILLSGDTAPASVAAMAATGLPVLHKPVRAARLEALLLDILRPQ